MEEIDNIVDTLDINTKRLLTIKTDSYKELSNYDLAQQDLLHLIEFEEPKFHDCLDVITELKRIRQKRRLAKDKITKIDNILGCIRKTEFIKAKNHVEDTYLKNRIYTNKIYNKFDIDNFAIINKTEVIYYDD